MDRRHRGTRHDERAEIDQQSQKRARQYDLDQSPAKRASLNATKHGLSASAAPIPARETEALAQTLAGGTFNPELMAPARRIVVAQARLRQTQAIRASYTVAFSQALDRDDSPGLTDALTRLARLERHERSALAQRRFAVHDLADASAKALLSPATAFFQNEAKTVKEINEEES